MDTLRAPSEPVTAVGSILTGMRYALTLAVIVLVLADNPLPTLALLLLGVGLVLTIVMEYRVVGHRTPPGKQPDLAVHLALVLGPLLAAWAGIKMLRPEENVATGVIVLGAVTAGLAIGTALRRGERMDKGTRTVAVTLLITAAAALFIQQPEPLWGVAALLTGATAGLAIGWFVRDGHAQSGVAAHP